MVLATSSTGSERPLTRLPDSLPYCYHNTVQVPIEFVITGNRD